MTTTLTRKIRHQRHTLILLLLALIALGALIAFAPLTKISYWGIDIYTFRAAAKAMASGENPYHEPNILRFADGATVGNIHNYIYAPYFAFGLRPLTWLSPPTASKLWFALNLALYFSSLTLLLKVINWQPGPRMLLLTLLGLTLFPPLRTTLTIGQSTVLSLFFFALALFLLKRNHPLWGGIIFSVGLFKPQLAPILLFFVLLRHWKFVMGVLLGSILLTLPFLNWLDNWLVEATSTRGANLSTAECFQMVSATSLAHCTIASSFSLLTILLVSLIIAILIIGFDLARSSRYPNFSPEVPDFDRYLALIIILNGLIIDHTRIADQLIFVFSLLVIWRDWRYFSEPWVRRIAMGLVFSIYLIPYTLDFLQGQAIVYLLPFWYIGISLALLTLLLSYQIVKPVDKPQSIHYVA